MSTIPEHPTSAGESRRAVYGVGDIHGMAGKLIPALQYLRSVLRPYDRVVFLGDYINRGPASKQVVELLLEFQRERPDTIFLRGNHEELLLNSLAPGIVEVALAERLRVGADRNAASLWNRYGGYDTLLSYGLDWSTFKKGFPAAHLEFIENLNYIHTDGPFTFVHAGLLPPELPHSRETGEDVRLWIRQEFIRSRSDFGTTVVFGHTPQLSGKPLIMPNKIGIDTGAVFGKKLTVLKVYPELSRGGGDQRVEYEQF